MSILVLLSVTFIITSCCTPSLYLSSAKKQTHSRRNSHHNYVQRRKARLILNKVGVDEEPARYLTGEENDLKHNIFLEMNVVTNADDHIYVDAQNGNDSKNGNNSNNAVKTLSRALKLVKGKPRPLSGNLIVHLSGTFEEQRLIVRDSHRGSSKNKRVIFRGDENGSTKLQGGESLNFVKVTSLPDNHPARKLAKLANTELSNIWAAAPASDFPTKNSDLRWPDGDCRDLDNYTSPPTLSINGNELLTRARTPNIPSRTASTGEESMGQTRDKWLRTNSNSNQGKVHYRASDKSHINKASTKSWDSGSVVLHIFPLVDWYDARVAVGTRSTSGNTFSTSTGQNAPGNPEGGNKFNIANEARYYLEGAVEYLDSAGEYFVSLGENIANSRGWTLMYPPEEVDVESSDFSAVLSVSKSPIIAVSGSNMNVSFENLHVEGGRRYLATVYANSVDFYRCSFVNAGFDAVDVYGQRDTFRNCIFEGTGGSALQLSDERDYDTDGKGFLLLESENALVDSLVSDFASTCRHYSEGVHLGGYGTIVSNNHFRSSNMAAIDVVGGGFKILHNVFSHVSDGSYDDGAIHWVAESPMERGTEVAYNVFFRNGVSSEPCNAKTSCYQSDVYMDDMAGAMTIHGNVMIKDKVLQSKPPSNKFSKIQWVSIFMNGGADVSVYENAFLGPVDGSTNGAIYNDKAVLFEQSCGGTIWPDDKSCGHTGVCKNDVFYKLMRKYDYKNDPWASAFPELLSYNANPASGSNWRCANKQSCPMAAWNNTVICNAGIGSNRELSNRAIWPIDVESPLNDDAVESVTVPARSVALLERGNKGGIAFNENVDKIESEGMASVLALSQLVASAAEATYPDCNEGSRSGAARSQLAGRLNNPCTNSWSTSGMASCDPCDGSVNCAPRDMPKDKQCSCGDPAPPTTSPAPNPSPTSSAPTSSKTLQPTPCGDSNKKFKKNGKMRTCEWLSKRKNPTVIKNLCSKKAAFCKSTCGFCSNNNAYKVYKGSGYCDGQPDKTIPNIAGAVKCWKQCKKKFKFVYAEFTDGVCYCQKTCPCMDATDDNKIIAVVPSGFKLPGQCLPT